MVDVAFFSYWTYKTMEITRKDVFFSYWTYKTMEIVRKKMDFYMQFENFIVFTFWW